METLHQNEFDGVVAIPTVIEDEVFLDGIELGKAGIPIRPIMRAAGVTNGSHVTKGKYVLKTLATSEKSGTFTIEVNGIANRFSVKGNGVFECDVELKENVTLQVNATINDGEVILCGLVLEPVDA